jgi:hypothetical protein
MKLKSILYKKEQDEIINKIIDILVLDYNNSIILYELDNDKIKQDKILELIPDIRKYFSFTSVIGASEPDKAKRPYLSIIRQLTKSKYNMLSCDYRIKEEGKGMRTLFRQNNYKTYLVDEFRTSCMCSICKTEIGRCEKFQIRKNPKPYKSGNILVHGIKNILIKIFLIFKFPYKTISFF